MKEEERFLTSAGRRFRRSESEGKSRPAPFGMTIRGAVNVSASQKGAAMLRPPKEKHQRAADSTTSRRGHDISCPYLDQAGTTPDIRAQATSLPVCSLTRPMMRKDM